MSNPNERWGLSVRGILKNENNEILLLKRNKKSRYEGEKWEFPGGKVDYGEYFEQALIREFKEETNIKITINSLFDSVESNFSSCRDGGIIKTVQIIMNVSIHSGDLKISNEHEDFKWFSLKEIEEIYNNELVSDTVKKVLEKTDCNI